ALRRRALPLLPRDGRREIPRRRRPRPRRTPHPAERRRDARPPRRAPRRRAMTEAARVAPARRMVRDLLRLLSLREIEPAAFDRLVEAIEHLEEGHTGARVTGESFPEALVGRESCEGKPFVLRDGVLRTAR